MSRFSRALLLTLGLVVIISTLFIVRSVSGTETASDYYLQAEVLSVNVTFSINGFLIDAKGPGQTMLCPLITPFLVDGKNTIAVTYLPNANSNEDSKLSWAVLENPAGVKTLKDAKRLMEGSVGSRAIAWAKLSLDDFTVSHGSIDGRHFFFERAGTQVKLGGCLSQAQAFTRLPSRLSYDYLEKPVTKASIHFKKSGTPIDVVFSGLTLKSGQQKIDLPPTTITSGAKWARGTGFDEILIEGDAEKTYGPALNLSNLSVAEIQGAQSDSKMLTLKLPHWHWQDGDRYTAITVKDQTAIWQITEQLYKAIESGNVPKQKVLLHDKMITNKQFMPLNAEQWQAFEKSCYVGKEAGLKLEPISQADMRYMMINPQVVKVTTRDGRQVIRSVPRKGASREVDLYFSHIGGKWVIAL